ncbi:MAG: RluA family pseudouridine synthase [Thermoleophilia bacterium]|nr:RluA family pseudouridine synthase [Thermoleophilia bacterium]
MLRFSVASLDEGMRLDAWLGARPGIGSRAEAERLLAAGRVLVDGQGARKSHRLAVGEEVEAEPFAAAALIPADLALDVRYEDEHLLVVEKPSGLATHPAGRSTVATLAHGLLTLGAAGGEPERPGIVHRLDRATSGLLVVARSEEAHTRLQELVRRREVERRYLALVRGAPRSRTGRIEAAVGRDRTDRLRRSLDTTTPRFAVTWFELLEQIGSRSLLDLRLETGRTHQIRVHLEAIGLLVCGDPVYGVAGDLGLKRQFLHAHRLAFDHPFSGARIDVSSPLPADLEIALERARAA